MEKKRKENASAKIFPAHIKDNGTSWIVQTVEEHCLETAIYAARSLQRINLYNTAYVAGLLHDMGKYTDEYTEYIEKAASGESVNRGSVNHTFAGVRYILENYHNLNIDTKSYSSGDAFRDLATEIIAFAIGAHHGMFDAYNTSHENGFLHRYKKEGVAYKESIDNFTNCFREKQDIKHLIECAEKEIKTIYLEKLLMIRQLPRECKADTNIQTVEAEEICFYLGLLARMVLSSVVEGDRRSTASFMQDRYPDSFPQLTGEEWKMILHRVDRRIEKLPADSAIAQARHQISLQCKKAGKRDQGIYRLNVPTGGGKTISSLRFALAHAAEHGMERIIFISPLLSILDQNAQVIRDYIEDDRIILEHHSNVVNEKNNPGNDESGQEKQVQYELLMENWNAPVIITTLVQFLNTLFSGKMSCVRRFHSLCSSVIVIDEVQTVPGNMITLFNLALNFLIYVCGATVVLCSATQPCLEQVKHPIRYKNSTAGIRDLVPYEKNIWNAFRRTSILDDGKMTLNQIPEHIKSIMENTESLLVICNKKNEAEQLFRKAKDYQKSIRIFHLSAAMCMEHRRTTLNRIKEALFDLQNRTGDQRKVLVISTQVIEAGVDISFGCVLRLCAGLDNIVQAAGRCNRNGESEMAAVYVLLMADEDLSRLKDIQRAQDATIELLTDYKKKPEKYKMDLSSDESAAFYYSALYRRMEEGYQDYKVKADSRPTSVYEMLSTNRKMYPNANKEPVFGQLRQAFREAGRSFSVFDQDTETVLVPYGEGEKLINRLGETELLYDYIAQEDVLRKAKEFSISMMRWELEKLERQGALKYFMDNRIAVLQEGFYDNELGFTMNQEEMPYREV